MCIYIYIHLNLNINININIYIYIYMDIYGIVGFSDMLHTYKACAGLS